MSLNNQRILRAKTGSKLGYSSKTIENCYSNKERETEKENAR